MSHHTSDDSCPLCEEKLKTAHEYIADWFRNKKKCYPNLHISWAFRDAEDQEAAFAAGKTRAHFPNSPHNRRNSETTLPESYALDLFQIDEDGLARFSPLFYAKLNEENQKDGTPIKWGGVFKTLGDYDHFQYAPLGSGA